MKTDHIVNGRQVGGDYFRLIFIRKSNKTLQEYIKDIDLNAYYILKYTRHQILVSIEELIEFKYSGYIFFKKELYNIENILDWCNWMKSIGGIQYLTKPTPPFNPQKIIIRQ